MTEQITYFTTASLLKILISLIVAMCLYVAGTYDRIGVKKSFYIFLNTVVFVCYLRSQNIQFVVPETRRWFVFMWVNLAYLLFYNANSYWRDPLKLRGGLSPHFNIRFAIGNDAVWWNRTNKDSYDVRSNFHIKLLFQSKCPVIEVTWIDLCQIRIKDLHIMKFNSSTGEVRKNL